MSKHPTELRFHLAQVLAVASELRRYGVTDAHEATYDSSAFVRVLAGKYNSLKHALLAHLNYNGAKIDYFALSAAVWSRSEEIVDVNDSSFRRSLDLMESQLYLWYGYIGPVSNEIPGRLYAEPSLTPYPKS